MKYRILRALIIKESLQALRDPSTILIAFVLPLLLLFIFGYGVNLDTGRIKSGLVLQSYDNMAMSLVNSFNHSRYFDITVSRDRQVFNNDLVAGNLRSIIVIPEHFEAKLKSRQIAPIQVITDGSEPQIASFAENYAQGVLQNWLNKQAYTDGQKATNSRIVLQPRYWYNEELKSRNFLIPGSIVIVMTLIGTLLTSLVIAREWERGTMEAMMATPISILEIILGKLIPYFLLGMGSMLLCTLIATGYYDVPFRGSIWVLVLISMIFLISALGQGLLISTFAKNQFMASQMALMSAFLPAFILSGFIFEIDSMPLPIQGLTYLFAARYFVTSLQTLFLAGNVWSLLVQSIGAMSLIGIIFFVIIAHNTQKRLN